MTTRSNHKLYNYKLYNYELYNSKLQVINYNNIYAQIHICIRFKCSTTASSVDARHTTHNQQISDLTTLKLSPYDGIRKQSNTKHIKVLQKHLT